MMYTPVMEPLVVGTNRLVGVNRVASMKWVVSQEGYFVLFGRSLKCYLSCANPCTFYFGWA